MAVSIQQRGGRRGYRRLDNALSPVFVRSVAKAGRYADGCRRFSASGS